mmetsp:Transcript_35121/g.42963  ORF Transcript_35121/g.42963 Transcript_35121/m.42963 type:complete len:121 (+) Transcript_35121:291-653(+)
MTVAPPEVKKSGTILSPHIEVLKSGSMLIEFDNMQSAHRLDQRLTGKIKIWLAEPFEAANLTLSLNGFLRSQFQAGAGTADYGDDKIARLAQTLCNVDYTLATFENGLTAQGMMEFPFSV